MFLPLRIGPLSDSSYRRVSGALEDVSGAYRYIPSPDHYYEDLPFDVDAKRTRGRRVITLHEIVDLKIEKKTLKMMSYLAYVMEVVKREQVEHSSALYSYLQFDENSGESYAVAINVSGEGALRIVSLDNDGWRESAFFAYRGCPASRFDETDEVIEDTGSLVP